MRRSIKPAFHDTDTDFLARILVDTFDTRDFLNGKLKGKVARHADILNCDDPREDVGVVE